MAPIGEGEILERPTQDSVKEVLRKKLKSFVGEFISKFLKPTGVVIVKKQEEGELLGLLIAVKPRCLGLFFRERLAAVDPEGVLYPIFSYKEGKALGTWGRRVGDPGREVFLVRGWGGSREIEELREGIEQNGLVVNFIPVDEIANPDLIKHLVPSSVGSGSPGGKERGF